MTDEFENAGAAPEIVPPAASVAEEEPGEDFFPAEEEGFAFDEAQYVTIRSSAGADRYVSTSEPRPLTAVIFEAGLTLGANVEAWLNGAKIGMADLVPVGSKVTLIGTVKGG